MKRKRDVDRMASELTRVPPYVVKMVTSAWIEAIQAILVEEGAVQIDSFGTFSIQTQAPRKQSLPLRHFGKAVLPASSVDVPTKICVTFSKAGPLKQALKRRYDTQGTKNMTKPNSDSEGMDKFGVNENVDQERLEKQAAEGCPLCGAKVQRHGTVLMCPTHGTEPFEKNE